MIRDDTACGEGEDESAGEGERFQTKKALTERIMPFLGNCLSCLARLSRVFLNSAPE